MSRAEAIRGVAHFHFHAPPGAPFPSWSFVRRVQMATTATQTYTETKRSLARAIKRHRERCLPIEIARLLLFYDQPDHQLVGIDYDAERVVYYHEETGQAYVCPFSDAGVDCDRGGPLASIEPPSSLECWIEKMECFWGWLHPRFR